MATRRRAPKGPVPLVIGGAGVRQPTRIEALAVSADGRAIATGDAESVVRVFDAASGAQTFEAKWPARDKGERHGIQRVFFSRDGRRVYAITGINGSGELCAADLATGKERFHTEERFSSLGLGPDGAELVGVTWGNGPLVIVDGETGAVTARLERPPKTLPSRVAWSGDGARIAALFYDHAVEDSPPKHKLWLIDPKTRAIIRRVDVDLEGAALGFARPRPDQESGDVVVVGRAPHAKPLVIARVDVASGAHERVAIEDAGGVYAAALLPAQGAVLLLRHGAHAAASLVDLASGRVRRVLPRDASAMACAEDTDLVVTARGVRLERADGETPRDVEPALTCDVRALAFRDGDRAIATQDRTGARVWTVPEAGEPSRLTWELEGRAIGLSADGAVAALCDEETTRLVELVSGAARGAPIAATPSEAVLSRDATLLAARGKDGAAIHATETGAIVGRVGGSEHLYGLAFAPDGARVATGVWAGTVAVTRVSDGASLATATLAGWGLGAIAWSADGEWLAVGDQKKHVWVGKARAAKLAPLVGHRRAVIQDVCFSPDGALLASLDEDALRLWDVATRAARGAVRVARGSSLAFSSDGARVAVGGLGFVHVYEVADVLGAKA